MRTRQLIADGDSFVVGVLANGTSFSYLPVTLCWPRPGGLWGRYVAARAGTAVGR
jgi:hypothetical protein